MKWSSQQYALAKNLGLMLWFERTAVRMLKPAQVFATLGVILTNKLATEAEHKLLEGILSVLSLEASCYWIGWFDEAQPGESLTTAHLVLECEKWRPDAVLGLGASLREIATKSQDPFFQNVQFTASYHPQELIENPSLKRKTYQDLLNLKEAINLIKAE